MRNKSEATLGPRPDPCRTPARPRPDRLWYIPLRPARRPSSKLRRPARAACRKLPQSPSRQRAAGRAGRAPGAVGGAVGGGRRALTVEEVPRRVHDRASAATENKRGRCSRTGKAAKRTHARLHQKENATGAIDRYTIRPRDEGLRPACSRGCARLTRHIRHCDRGRGRKGVAESLRTPADMALRLNGPHVPRDRMSLAVQLVRPLDYL